MSTYPLPDRATIEAHYSKKSASGNYNLLRQYSNQYRSVYRTYLKVLEELLEPSAKCLKGVRILDIGCFTGEFLALLETEGADVYGLELQPEAVAEAQAKLPGRVFQADVFSNDFPAMTCDVVSLLGVIEHVVDPVRLLKRACELLAPGGVLLVQTPDSSSFFARVLGRYWPPYAPVEHIHLFSRRALGHVLKGLGLEEIGFRAHWKRLPIAYIYGMLQHFGPELRRVLTPLVKLLPARAMGSSLPFYVGEVIVSARKPA